MPRTKHGPASVAIVVSDLHCGCQVGLCPPVCRLDGGGTYRAISDRAQRLGLQRPR